MGISGELLRRSISANAPGEVESAPAFGSAVAHEPGHDRDGRQRNRHVDQEHPTPRRELRDHTAEEDPDREAEARQGSPQTERLRAFRTCREQTGHESESGRRGQCSPDSLQHARTQQHLLGRGHAVQQRREAEYGRARQKHPAAAEQIGDAAAE